MPEDSASEARPGRKAFTRQGIADFARRHWPVLIVLGIMLVAFLVRMYYLSRHVEATADSYYFMILARSMRDTFTYTVRGVAHTKYLPGYPITMWFGGYLLGGIEQAANMIAVLGGTFTVLATYGIGRELFNKWAGLVAALVVAFQPTFLKWTVLPMTEGLFTFLFAAGIYLAITGSKRASPERRVLAALCGGLCFLVRWEGILFLPLMGLVMLVYIRGSKIRAWEPVVILALFGGPMSVYVLRNLIVTGKVTAYAGEFTEYSQKVKFVLKDRIVAYAWNGLSDAAFSALFIIGAVYTIARRKWQGFLIAVGWFALFAGFHLFWYYAYERFMAPAVPAVALIIGFMFADLAALTWAFLAQDGRVAARLSGRPFRRPSQAVSGAGPVPGLQSAGDSAFAESMAPEDEEESFSDGDFVMSGPVGPSQPDGAAGERSTRRSERKRPLPSGLRVGLKAGQVACVVVLALVLAAVMWHGLSRADTVIKQNYQAFADDHGGQGMKHAAEWLNANAPAQLVAANAGPYFQWLYYPGDVLYMRQVPWDLPVEAADIEYRDTVKELNSRGVRYLVVCEAQQDVEKEIDTFGIRGKDREYLKEAASWTDHYDYPTPHDMRTVVFEVLQK